MTSPLIRKAKIAPGSAAAANKYYNTTKYKESSSSSNKPTLAEAQKTIQDRGDIAYKTALERETARKTTVVNQPQTSTTSQLNAQERINVGLDKSPANNVMGNTMSAADASLKAGTQLSKLKDPIKSFAAGVGAGLKGEPLTGAPGNSLGVAGYYTGALVPFTIGGTVGQSGKITPGITKGTGKILTKSGKFISSATITKFTSWSTRVARQFTDPKMASKIILGIIVGSVAGKAFGQKFLGVEETGQGADITSLQAYNNAYFSSPENADEAWAIYDEARANEDEVYKNPTVIEEIVSYLGPFAVGDGVKKNAEHAIANNVVFDALAKNRQKQQQEGLSDNEMYELEREQRIQDENLQTEWTINQWNLFDQRKREADNRDMKEDAAFWAKQRDEERKKAEKDRQAIADFWLAYDKMKAKSIDDSRPSALNFGLL